MERLPRLQVRRSHSDLRSSVTPGPMLLQQCRGETGDVGLRAIDPTLFVVVRGPDAAVAHAQASSWSHRYFKFFESVFHFVLVLLSIRPWIMSSQMPMDGFAKPNPGAILLGSVLSAM